jgi:hypothetical protein
MEVLWIAVLSAANIACFFVGAKVGQAVAKGNPVEIPVKTPVQIVKELKAEKESAREKDRMETILSNMENYDGTGNGQKDIPRW